MEKIKDALMTSGEREQAKGGGQENANFYKDVYL